MKKNTCYLLSFFVVGLIVMVSGCEMIVSPITYEPSPTKVRYDLSYGYSVNCSGTGRYQINYGCNTPEVLNGSVTYDILFPQDYTMVTLVNNTFVQWNVSGDHSELLTLGITAHVTAESVLLTDLSGQSAASIQELQTRYSSVVNQYTRLQGNETVRYIDPNNPEIIDIATSVQRTVHTNNSLLVAKALFAWLKEHIQYQTHPNETGVRPAAETLTKQNGDCDDLSFLYVSLCRVVHIPARFIRGYLVIQDNNGDYAATAHAWAEVFVGNNLGENGWISVECACNAQSIDSNIHQNFGVENAQHLRLFIDDGTNTSLEFSLLGISYTYSMNRIIQVYSFAELKSYQQLESKKLVITPESTRYYE